jgi:hypothetical protein
MEHFGYGCTEHNTNWYTVNMDNACLFHNVAFAVTLEGQTDGQSVDSHMGTNTAYDRLVVYMRQCVIS